MDARARLLAFQGSPAIFAHIAVCLQHHADLLNGSAVLLFDVDEHTGSFGGAKAYFEGPGAPARVDEVLIGYPSLDHIVTGGRGVLRARMHIHGVAAHSGGSKGAPGAIAKAAALISELGSAQLPGSAGPHFPLPARLTVTAISSGEGYSTVPDLCTFNVDVRLTPALDDTAALALLRSSVAVVDAGWPGTQPTHVEITTRWPAYALPGNSALRGALLGAARAAGLNTTAKVAGPSNIGKLPCRPRHPCHGRIRRVGCLHGTDERIRLESVPQVQAVYHRALLTLLHAS